MFGFRCGRPAWSPSARPASGEGESGRGLGAGPDGRDWPDNWQRFAALARAGADLASGLVPGRYYDILHAHDWQAGMAPAYLRFAPGPRARAASLLTIHNIAFQGRFDRSVFDALGLPADDPGLARRGEGWAPWRSYATVHLWRARV